MKKLIILLFSSLLFSAEMEVDGNLKVTGTVESATIDSLKAVIADLQAQLAALQGTGILQTRVVTLDNIFLTPGSNHEDRYEINFQEIFGIDLDYAIVSLLNLEYVTGSEELHIELKSANLNIHSQIEPNGTLVISDPSPLLYNKNFTWDNQYENYFNNNLYFYCGTTVTFTAIIAITAQFPN